MPKTTTETPKEKSVKKEVPTSLKGTRDHIGDEYYRFQGMFEKAQEIACYYGFRPIETPVIEKLDVFTSAIGDGTDIVEKEMYAFSVKGGDKIALRPEYTAGIMRSYIENGMQTLPQPVLLYAYGQTFRHENPQRGRLREFRQFDLEILGTEKSIADALVIRTLYTILEEFGFKDLTVDINSMGDRDTRNSYVKDLTNYYKKNVANMCADCIERVKTNPLRLLDCKKEECQKYKENAPQSIAYLSADARKHFKEVLQYLEEMNISYRINHTLVRGFNYYNRTVFEVVKLDVDEKGHEKEISICGGGRYDPLARDMGSKKDVPAVGTGMSFERIMLFPECRDLSPRILKTPKVYFIQLGFDAKLKSLTVIEILRKAKVPVHQNLSKDSLGVQLAMAEKMNIPYCIIFGQKEAVDGTVIVRKMAERHQDVVKIEALAEYLKNIK